MKRKLINGKKLGTLGYTDKVLGGTKAEKKGFYTRIKKFKYDNYCTKLSILFNL